MASDSFFTSSAFIFMSSLLVVANWVFQQKGDKQCTKHLKAWEHGGHTHIFCSTLCLPKRWGREKERDVAMGNCTDTMGCLGTNEANDRASGWDGIGHKKWDALENILPFAKSGHYTNHRIRRWSGAHLWFWLGVVKFSRRNWVKMTIWQPNKVGFNYFGRSPI